MKKSLFIFIVLLFTACLSLHAQEQSSKVRGWIALDNNITSISDKLPVQRNTFYIPYLTFGLEIRLIDEWAVVGELGIGTTKFPRLAYDINWFGELDKDSKLEIQDYSKFGKREIPFRTQIGISHRFHLKAWHITPQIGIGMSYLSSGTGYTYDLKEKDTDKMYRIEYRTLKEKRHDDTDRSAIFGFSQWKLRTGREISKALSIEFAVGYSYCLRSAKVYGRYIDSATDKVIDTKVIGKRPHELTLSVGVGFR